MAKSLNQRLIDLQCVLAGLYIRSNDVRYINVYPASNASVTLHPEAFYRILVKLGLSSKDLSKAAPDDERIRLELKYQSVEFCCWFKSHLDATAFARDLDRRKPSDTKAARPTSPPPQKAKAAAASSTSNAKPQAATHRQSSGFPSYEVPRSAHEARRVVARYWGVEVYSNSDKQLLELAKKGQIRFHPDRSSGDAHMSRVFNATADLLKRVL